MTEEQRQEIMEEVRNAACSCDAMYGYTCKFCHITLPKLRKVLEEKVRVSTKSPYEPRGVSSLRRHF